MDSRRRQLLIAAGTALAAPHAYAQQSQKIRRIGVLSVGPITAGAQRFWREGLQRAGFEEGKNLSVEWRSADADAKRVPSLAEELVRLKVELIVTLGTEAHDAAKHATQSVPIVMFACIFPAERGLIKSFARPGGNVTGTVWYQDPEVTISKKYQIFRDGVPNASRVSSIWYGADPIMRFWDIPAEHRRAKEIGLSVQDFPIQRAEELKSALDRVAASRPDVLFVGGNLAYLRVYEEIAGFALRHKLVSYSDSDRYPNAGGLLAYGPNVESLRDLTFSYVDKILHGAKPADLPVQQATKWDLTLNAKTAQAIGFKPPAAFMLQVTQQIE